MPKDSTNWCAIFCIWKRLRLIWQTGGNSSNVLSVQDGAPRSRSSANTWRSATLTRASMNHSRTLPEKIYGETEVTERHRHRYEFNMEYRDRMNAKGFVISGTSPDGALAELIELRDHPYFVGCQYHPEFQSKPNKPHPLFKGFIQACLARQADRTTHARADQESLHRVPERELVPQ